MKIRVRAVIIKDNKVLLIKRTKENLVYWVIPGGAVEKGETKEEALMRECKEELGIEIKIKELLLEMPSEKLETKGHQEYFYLGDIIGGELGAGQGPEFQLDSIYQGSYDIEWKNINDLKKINLKPEEIKNIIISD